MINLNELCVSIDETVIDTIKQLDKGAKKVIFVVEDEVLVGAVTDGDIRRWILRNGDLSASVTEIMNKKPIYVYEHQRVYAINLLKEHQLQAIPLINKEHKIIDVIFLSDIFKKHDRKTLGENIDCPVVIMAGGKGTRLHPYTKVLPKPLIPIGDLTIIERIINQFKEFNCNDFYITVNYKKNMIKAYLEDKIDDYKIKYVEEEKFLGTGGSLYLLKNALAGTFFVSNCDILVEADYSEILKYHKENGYKITMVTSLKNYVIPYGVVEIEEGGSIKQMLEKPEFNFNVNTGLYILEAEILKDIPENEFFHITDLINMYIKKGEKVGIYPVTENSWMDMGEIKEMENMSKKFEL